MKTALDLAPEPEPGVSVSCNIASHTPGATPVAFLAVVEVIDADGEKQYVTITSDSITERRLAALVEHLRA